MSQKDEQSIDRRGLSMSNKHEEDTLVIREMEAKMIRYNFTGIKLAKMCKSSNMKDENVEKPWEVYTRTISESSLEIIEDSFFLKFTLYSCVLLFTCTENTHCRITWEKKKGKRKKI